MRGRAHLDDDARGLPPKCRGVQRSLCLPTWLRFSAQQGPPPVVCVIVVVVLVQRGHFDVVLRVEGHVEERATSGIP